MAARCTDASALGGSGIGCGAVLPDLRGGEDLGVLPGGEGSGGGAYPGLRNEGWKGQLGFS